MVGREAWPAYFLTFLFCKVDAQYLGRVVSWTTLYIPVVLIYWCQFWVNIIHNQTPVPRCNMQERVNCKSKSGVTCTRVNQSSWFRLVYLYLKYATYCRQWDLQDVQVWGKTSNVWLRTTASNSKLRIIHSALIASAVSCVIMDRSIM